jgi:predicted NACHT family NTPase
MGTLVVAVYRNMTTLPEGKPELYRIFVDLLCGGWDMAKGVRRESEFGSALKLRVLMRLASVLHEARTRVGTSSPFKSVVNETAPALADQWEGLLGDMIQDGLIVRNGGTLSFAHLSFQEYLAARDLADPTNKRQDQALRRFLDGDDWWGEVMAFYVAMSKRPRDMEAWLNSVEQQAGKRSIRSDEQEIRRRAAVLRTVILDCSPAYRPQGATT